MPRICDYEGSQYRTDFWEGQNRSYEDAVERVAMQKMLPPSGHRLVEIGGGFGRLVDLYQGYSQIVLTDYARTQLEEAQDYLGQDPRLIYVVADVYNLPFVDNLFDALTMVRVMHHLVDVPSALAEIYRIVVPQGTTVIEHASKFHLKSLLRWFLGQQAWSPFDPAPLEFVELNFDFYPAWMREQFEKAGLRIENVRTLSHYRLDLLKRTIPTSLLVKLDSWAQPSGNWWQLTPSIFLQAQAHKLNQPFATGFFRCPTCKFSHLILTEIDSIEGQVFVCARCRHGWSYRDGIYDFKTPLILDTDTVAAVRNDGIIP
ncbi:MAG: class I SAM-dependent methyltransferase [Anaerolineae bacterium]|nr:class I SAM-dependent methyltransferase [Anaerolineae bacterium]